MNEPQAIRMLYLVGEPDGAERVDVSDLFARRLANMGLTIDYVIFESAASGFWKQRQWRGAKAFVNGRSSLGGITGKIVNKLLELAADFRTFWQALVGPYDVIQVRDKFVVGVLGLLAARLSGKKFVYWLSYPFAECRILDGKEGRAAIPWISILGGNIAALLLYRIIMPFADHVFVQSRQMMSDVASEGVDVKLMTPVPMGVSEDLLDEPDANIEPDTVLYLGTMIRVRRLTTIIEAFAEVKQKHADARLIMVGDGPHPEDRACLERLSEKLGLQGSVEFTGNMPLDQALERVSRAAVCLSPFYPTPILQSTSPTKISEYMALGRPVVANTHPEQSIILAESGAGICVEWSADAFAAAINQLLEDPQAARIMGARGRDYVRNHRIYPVIAEPVAAEYKRLFDSSIKATDPTD